MTTPGLNSWIEGDEGTPVPLEGGVERRMGRYVLSRRIASGGMGTVYLARAVGPGGFDLPVAIKVIHPHLARRKDLVDMFLDEARITARIRHPNVCRVLDFGEAAGTWYLAMEYLRGETVSTIVGTIADQPGTLDSPRYRAIAVRILADACEGLHAAHELTDDAGRPLNVVHRDVSPHNLTLTYDGAVKVLDFGIALAKGRVHQTTTGGLKGKYAYMPPEQLAKRPLDRRSDVWALGVCAWEMLAGGRLFRRDNEMDTLLAVREEEIVAPSAVRPSVPPELDSIVLRALERDPSRRWASARELGRALSAWLRTQPEPHGMVEAAEWMEELFHERGARKADVVRTVMSTGVVTSEPGGSGEPGESAGDSAQVESGRLGAGSAGTLSVAPGIAGRIGTATGSVPAGPPSPGAGGSFRQRASAPAVEPPWTPGAARRREVSIVALGAAFVLLLVGVGVGLGLWLGGGEELPEAAGVGVEPVVETAGGPAAQVIAEPESTAIVVPEEDAPPEEETPASSVEAGGDLRPAPRMQRRRPRMNAPASSASAMTPTPAPTPEAAGRGSVNVVTPGGWAEVFVGGRSYGRTPRRIELPAGSHVIELRPFGQTPAVRVPATVRADEATRVVRAVTR